MLLCTHCGAPNAAHHRFCLSCGADLRVLDARLGSAPSEPSPALVVPAQRPRTLAKGKWGILKTHGFGLFFGSIWALIGGILLVVFGSIGLFMPPMLLGALIASPFFFIGTGIVLVALFRAMLKHHLAIHGTLVLGQVVSSEVDSSMRVNGRPARRITFSTTDAGGRAQTGYVQSFDDDVIHAHPPGLELPLLVDPTDPSTLIAPSMLGIQFVQPAPVIDSRPDHVNQGALREPSMASWSAPLRSDTQEGAARLPFWLRLFRKKPQADAGSLSLDAQGGGGLLLRQDDPQVEPRSVALDRPFSLICSTWPVSASTTELNVTVRQRGAGADDPGVRFKATLPQSRVSKRVDAKQEAVATLDPEDFDALWSTLRYFASVHGEPLPEVADVADRRTLPPSSPAGAKVAEAQHAQARRL